MSYLCESGCTVRIETGCKSDRGTYRRAQARFVRHPGPNGIGYDACVCCDCTNALDAELANNKAWLRIAEIDRILPVEAALITRSGDKSSFIALANEKNELLKEVYRLTVEFYAARKARAELENQERGVFSWM